MNLIPGLNRRHGFGRAVLMAILALMTAAGSFASEDERTVTGVVRDATGSPLPGADVSLLNSALAPLAATKTDAAGRFTLIAPFDGRLLLRVAVLGFAEHRHPIEAGKPTARNLAITLSLAMVRDEVTVTANPGLIESIDAVAQPVNVIPEDELRLRSKAVVAQVVEGETGVHLQRTSPTIGGIYVRGLTGNKVNVFVDGVRFSNSSQRGGINTFLDLVEVETLERVEVLRGPGSAQYGSDALGGSVQFLTRSPSFSVDRARLHGSWSTSFSSAELSFGSHLVAAYSTPHFGLVASGGGRRVNTLRPGDGRDSHNARTRFFGLDSEAALDDGRLPDTAFTQYGGMLRAAWAVSPSSQLGVSYTRSQQDGGKRYDQLLGGDGNLVADLRNLMLDRFQARYDRFRVGGLDELALVYSYNSQREERVNQGGSGNPQAAITHEYERTSVHGLEVHLGRHAGRHSLGVGADSYFESVRAPSFSEQAGSGATSVRRGRVPDRARYWSGGVHLRDVFEVAPDRLRLAGNLRFSTADYRSRAADSPLVNQQTLWPDDSLRSSDLTYRAGLVLRLTRQLSLSASGGKGFRAPHITDLGTLGLTGSGYEVAAPDVIGRGGTIGTTADAGATSTGIPVEQVRSERSRSWEGSIRCQAARIDTDLTVFVNDIDGNIEKLALILPPGAVGQVLGDQSISSQTEEGAVFVPASTSPVLVRANYSDARISGIEHTLHLRLGRGFVVSTAATLLHAEDRAFGRPPNIEGGTPASDVHLRFSYRPGSGRLWAEAYLHAAARQTRLSTLDLQDRRTGASRSRSSIKRFFENGARARGWTGPGADGVMGTSDDVLIATGETLSQIQSRVLGPNVDQAPLYAEVPGYVVICVRAGWRFGSRHQLLVDVENLTDRNYRGVSWGMDAAGRGVSLRYSARF